jgi:hypothetical protein
VNVVTGLIDIPFFHVSDIFGYWPFGKTSAIIWSVYDNNINYKGNQLILPVNKINFDNNSYQITTISNPIIINANSWKIKSSRFEVDDNNWNITGNLLSDLGNINTYRIADISKDGLIYEATLSNKNIIINDNIIDYVELKSQNNDFIKIDEIILKSVSEV